MPIFQMSKLARLTPLTRLSCFGIGAFFIGALAFGGIGVFFHYTNSNEFCTSCHSMQINKKEYRQTLHYKNTAGVAAACADCHVPKAFFPMFVSKVVAARDVFSEIVGTIDTEEKFEARRWLLANRVWQRMQSNDSRECRSCHDYNNMNYEKQDKRTAKKHQNATRKGRTCIDCHAGIAHEEPLAPDEP